MKHAPRETVIKVSNSERLLRNFLFFIVKLNLELYVALSHLKPCQTSQRSDLSGTLYSAGYEFCREAALHRQAPGKPVSKSSLKYMPPNFQ